MGFDILVVIRHLASNTPISGYLTKVPLSGEDATAADAQAIVDAIQEQFGQDTLKYVTLFTRKRDILFAGSQVPIMQRTSSEVTIPKHLLQGSILELQILELKEQA